MLCQLDSVKVKMDHNFNCHSPLKKIKTKKESSAFVASALMKLTANNVMELR